MSCQKGNTSRTRPQKHQNSSAFKNNLYDTSNKTKLINSIQVVNVCMRCKSIIEWKIKYKKYKPLKGPKKCTKCDQKTIKHAYHMLCSQCAKVDQVCPKCGKKEELVTGNSQAGDLKQDSEIQQALKHLPERKRRTILRNLDKERKTGDETESLSKENILDKIKSMSMNDDEPWGDSDDSVSSGEEDDFEDCIE